MRKARGGDAEKSAPPPASLSLRAPCLFFPPFLCIIYEKLHLTVLAVGHVVSVLQCGLLSAGVHSDTGLSLLLDPALMDLQTQSRALIEHFSFRILTELNILVPEGLPVSVSSGPPFICSLSSNSGSKVWAGVPLESMGSLGVSFMIKKNH